MNTSKEKLLRTLLDLARSGEPLSSELTAAIEDEYIAATSQEPFPHGLDHPPQADIYTLPDEISKKLDEIVNVFKNIGSEKEDLAGELLSSYNHLNTAFDATVAVASNKNIQQAVQTLISEISHAIDSNYCYYFGDLAEKFPQSPNEKNEPGMIIAWPHTPEEQEKAHKFHRKYKTELTEMSTVENELQVRMIDYQGAPDPDHEGRGNVLAIRLNSIENEPVRHRSQVPNQPWQPAKLGTLIFVRTGKKKPFQAVEMNMAGMLARMGSAVLGNIIYADKIQQLYLETITALVRAMEAKDEYTSGHSTRVAEMACMLARHINLNEIEVKQLEWAGQLHDIGKIGIRDDVLCKTDKLTEEEFTHIKTHPVLSHKVLEPLEGLRGILSAVRHHHEHYDGKGYPDGLAEEAIPLHARILQIADVWDALTSTRSYRGAISPKKAKEIMHAEAGTTMDPKLVAEFLELLDERDI
ncbi:MAG: HD-GYP domain-containing protein [Sedimentisphaerales bacterium]|nr:HD-GYP domain-containing protein [Sedimentisphaerales bacterium]